MISWPVLVWMGLIIDTHLTAELKENAAANGVVGRPFFRCVRRPELVRHQSLEGLPNY